MNKLIEEIQEKLSTKMYYSGLALFLIFMSISLLLILISFSSDDPSWGFRSNKTPINFYGIYGAWLAGFVIRELGIFPGLLTSLILFIWSLKLFNRSNFVFFKLKLLTFLLMIFLNALGSAYFEGILYNNLQFKLSIINLNRYTASLPILNLKINSKAYGKNTKDALNAGFLWGYQGLINNIIKKIKTSFNCNFKIILTGGYSKIFSKFINNNSTIEPNITIKGIMHIYKNLIK